MTLPFGASASYDSAMQLACLLVTILVAWIPSLILAQDPAVKPEVPSAKQPTPPANATPTATEEKKAPEMPPEFKAFNEAIQKRDALDKIAALEKLLADFPKSPLANNARSMILDSTAREWPGDETRIRNLIRSMLAGATGKDRAERESQIASSLSNAGVLLRDAEKNAAESIKLMKLAPYAAEQKENAEKRKAKPPTDAEIEKRFKEQVASRQVTLGNIYYKQGKDQKAEPLYKAAFEANKNLPSALTPLARYAERRGDEKAAFEYLTYLRLSGGGPADTRTKFNTLYSKLKGGREADAETYLDGVYRAQYPNPLHVEPYVKTAARTGRTVLAEVFTGAGCGPCVAADLAFDAVLERYSRKEVVVLMYHQHIPLPDPMTNAATQARAKYYKVSGVPSSGIDGKTASGGGGRANVEEFWKRTNPDIEKRLELGEEATLTLDAKLAGLQVSVRTAGSVTKSGGAVRLQVALVEEMVRYSGENGVRYHPMVVRDLAGTDHGGFAFDAAKPTEVIFDLTKIAEGLTKSLDDLEKERRMTFRERKTEIDRTHLGVVAFLQDEKTKQVLQSVYVPLGETIEKGTQ